MDRPSEWQRVILLALAHGALDLERVCRETNLPPFQAHAELRAMERQNYVIRRARTWTLTEKGMVAINLPALSA